MQNIRNFSIIAHVNHGKSTLSDRLIEICGGLREKEMVSQVLDSMELERERGITIKSQSVTLNYKALNGQNYQLNLIDTPGHVDFSYEVFRSLAACQGAILVIDANQGVEAQTVANYKVAKEMNLKIITVLNKVDLSTVNFSRVFEEIYEIIGINVETDAIKCSAKTGFGILRLLEHLICNIPSPTGNSKSSLQALIIDSWFDNYLGIVSLICVKNGEIKVGDKIKSINTGKKYVVEKLGIFTPKKIERKILHCGEVGWVVCSTKNVRDVFVGDTLTSVICPTKMLLPKFKKVQPYVYAGLFPTDNRYQDAFRNAIYKLSLNDASLFCEKEKSDFLGLGFRCGFLGLLHMDIIRERLKREYLLDVIITSPVVAYEVLIKNGRIVFVDSCLKFLSLKNIKEIREPIVECNVFVPKQYLGKIISLCIEKRGISIDIKYYTNQVALIYELPMSEIILDFFDRLKSFSHGYASFNYKFKCFRTANIVCVEILINSQRVNLLSVIIHQSNVIRYCRLLVDKLKLSIPRQQFDIVIQAVVGNKVIVRATIKQLRKNVLAKCHGGDVTRKKKLLCNQKIGKKRMKKIGKVVVPNSIFLSMLNINYNKK